MILDNQLFFTKQPGNIPDVITVDNALAELKALGVKAPEIITDNGYYSEKNITELLHVHFNFIMLAKPSLTWIRKELQEHCEALEDFDNICQFDVDVYGIHLP